jgi:tetratricopeptide (TPR) repeat protein
MITRGDYNQAKQAINDVYLTMLRKDAAFFQNIPANKLTTTLITGHNYTQAHLEVLAELLYAEASLLYTQNKKDNSLPYYQKSLQLFEFVDNAYRTYSGDRLEKMGLIRKRISEIGEAQDLTLLHNE